MSSPAADRRLRATLFEIGLHSSDPHRLVAFYRDALGYSFKATSEEFLGTARDRRLRIRPGAARTLAYAAYAVPGRDDLEALIVRVTRAGVAVEPVDETCFGAGGFSFRDPDGNCFVFCAPEEAHSPGVGVTAERPARIQHVVFASTDIGRLLSFFTDVVGFTLSDRVVDEDGGLRTAFVRCGEEHHSLAMFAAKEKRLDHFCYEAGDWGLIRDWADHFASLRIPLKWGPGRHGPGNNLFLFIHDPDGNWVEISAELERVVPDRPVGDWPHEQHTLNSWGTGLLRS